MLENKIKKSRKRENLIELTDDKKNRLRQRVEEKGGQTTIVKLTGIPAPTLSKILSLGPYKKINRQTFATLLDTLELSETFEEVKKAFKVGCGFTIWSAPVILGLYKPEWFKDSLITSFGKNDNTTNYLLPMWSNNTDKVIVAPRLNLFDSFPPFNTDIVKSPSDYHGFTARELIELLNEKNEGSHLLDCIIIPKSVIDEREQHYITVASLIYSITGSTVISVFSKESQKEKVIDSSNPEEVILEFAKEGKQKIGLFYPPGTVCENHLRTFLMPLFSKSTIREKKITRENKPIDISNPEDVLIEINNYLKKNEQSVVFLLGWDPNNEWVKSLASPTTSATCCYQGRLDLLKLMSELNHTDYFEFSVIVRNDEQTKNTWLRSSVLKQFLQSLKSAIEEINLERRILISRWNNKIENYEEYYSKGNIQKESVVPKIAYYLGLPINKTAEALYDINFSFTINADFFLKMY